jgi:hypothetical protein
MITMIQVLLCVDSANNGQEAQETVTTAVGYSGKLSMDVRL